MKITNNTSAAIIAFGWQVPGGFGDDVLINPGETKEVDGPFVSDGVNGKFFLIPSEAICHEEYDDEIYVKIIEGYPVTLEIDGCMYGVYIRHHNDPALDQVREWREAQIGMLN